MKVKPLFLTALLFPELNPVLTKFLSIPPPTLTSPRSVLDVPVLLHLISTHDFAQDTLFTRFIVAYFQNSPLPEANPAEARKVFEKMKTALAPKQEYGHRESKDLQKQLDHFINRMQEYKKRIFPNE